MIKCNFIYIRVSLTPLLFSAVSPTTVIINVYIRLFCFMTMKHNCNNIKCHKRILDDYK